jgi:hypothetical protein
MPARPKAIAADTQQAQSELHLEKNPSICLVYDVHDAGGRIVSRKQVLDDMLKAERSSFRDKSLATAIGPRLCADGDSWINILWPLSSAFGHQKTFFDVLQDSYRTKDVAYPGDTFRQMLAMKDYRQPIASRIYDFFIFSGGGNDVLGGGALVELLRSKSEGGGSTDRRNTSSRLS